MDKKIVKRLLMWEDLKFPKSNKNKLNEMKDKFTCLIFFFVFTFFNSDAQQTISIQRYH